MPDEIVNPALPGGEAVLDALARGVRLVLRRRLRIRAARHERGGRGQEQPQSEQW
jgi:hypothetical protein